MVVPAGPTVAKLTVPPGGLTGGGVVLGGLAVQPVRSVPHKFTAKSHALTVADDITRGLCSCSLPRKVMTVARASSIDWPAANPPGSILSITSCWKIFNTPAYFVWLVSVERAFGTAVAMPVTPKKLPI